MSSETITEEAEAARDEAVRAAATAVAASEQVYAVSSNVTNALASGVLNLSATFLGFSGGLLKGDKGETGAQGPVGPRGPAGPAGTPGTMGARGVTISTERPTANTGIPGDFWIVVPR